MYSSEDGQKIRCDSPGCGAEAGLPVALRATLHTASTTNTAEGWLFILRPGGSLHYCPNCAMTQIPQYQTGEDL